MIELLRKTYEPEGDSSPDSSPNSSPNNDVILFEAHGDTLGGMVKQIKSNGRLLVSPLGGLVASNVETENVRVYTRDNKIYEGTFQLANASSHVNRELNTKERTFDTVEIVLDEKVNSKEDVKNLLDNYIDSNDVINFIINR